MKTFALAMILIGTSVMLTGCEDIDYGYYPPVPPVTVDQNPPSNSTAYYGAPTDTSRAYYGSPAPSAPLPPVSVTPNARSNSSAHYGN